MDLMHSEKVADVAILAIKSCSNDDIYRIISECKDEIAQREFQAITTGMSSMGAIEYMRGIVNGDAMWLDVEVTAAHEVLKKALPTCHNLITRIFNSVGDHSNFMSDYSPGRDDCEFEKSYSRACNALYAVERKLHFHTKKRKSKKRVQS